MTGKDPIEIPLSGGTFRAFIFSSGVEALDIEAFRDDSKRRPMTFYEFIKFGGFEKSPKSRHPGERRGPEPIDLPGFRLSPE